MFLDVVVASEETADAVRRRARACRDGVAAQAAADAKRARYPRAGAALVPVALEAGGRLGAEAAALLRTFARLAGDDQGTAPLRRLMQQVSTCLQIGNPEHVLGALHGPAAGRRG